ITHLDSVHKLVVPLSIKWADLEEQDGDLITLNSDLEFEQVLCAGARVKFLLTLPQDAVDQPDNDWDVSSTSSFDTISEEPVLVQQENEREEEEAIYFDDMDIEEGSHKLSVRAKHKRKEEEIESEIPSSRSVEVDIFHDSINSLHSSSQVQQQERSEEHDQEVRHIKIIETSYASANEHQPNIQEQSDQPDERSHSTVEGLSTKFEKVIQQCCKVLGDNPEMLEKVDSIMDHVLENTPMYIEFVLNILNSAKDKNRDIGTSSSNEDSSAQDHIDNSPNMPEVDLSAEAFLLNGSTREEIWHEAIIDALGEKAGDYLKLESKQLVGILLMIFVKKAHMPYIKEVRNDCAGVGLMGMMGNKGGTAIRFQFHDSYLCFVNCHLAADPNGLERRNQDYMDICRRMTFPINMSEGYSSLYGWVGDYIAPSAKYAAAAVVGMGGMAQGLCYPYSTMRDLNYRVDALPEYKVRELVDDNELELLLNFDQVHSSSHLIVQSETAGSV
ncbi:16102_t:CDS:2, partial [Acaulospora colombiana]